MKSRKPLAALAALFLAALQGCQTEQAMTNSGDRSSEGKGSVAFRLSPKSIAVLRSDSSILTYKVFGPGIVDTIIGNVAVDTMATYIQGIPCGFRFVTVSSKNRDGAVGWYGIDSLEVNPNQNSFAHITLRKPTQTGGLFLDISMDSASFDDSLVRIKLIDTTWSSRLQFSWYPYASSYQCGSISWAPSGRGSINCTRTDYRPFNIDTVWVDTTVHYQISDTAHWCNVTLTDSAFWPVDTLSRHVPLTCYRPHYTPSPSSRDTVWGDSALTVPVRDSSYHCYSAQLNDTVRTICIRPVYRPSNDSNVLVPPTKGRGKGKTK